MSTDPRVSLRAGDSAMRMLRHIASLNAWLRKVFHDNAARLFDLPER
uniref:Uncharacterized protein n=1 Tax=Mycobacterium riyadhense TaxID=486698 RepID=A0A653ERU7_9MYCO|nr:hypothetical protein BIN_B_03304 [Mycobacterium riyadhense]